MLKWTQAVWSRLAARLADGRFPHAIMLAGQPGVGKVQLARQIAHSALCTDPAEGHLPCERCRSCTLFLAGTHPDYHWLEPGPDSVVVKIDQVRELIAKTSLTSSIAPLQVFIISPADAMTTAAANAFLKTLEEPTPHTLIILVASRTDRLPATVRSRCQIHQVPMPDRETALDWLQESGLDQDDESLRAALDAAAGAPLLARELISQGQLECYQETLRDLNALSAGRGNVLELTARWGSGQECDLRLDWWCKWVKELIWRRIGRSLPASSPLTLTADFASLINYLDRLLEGRRLLATTVSKELLLEELLIGWRDLKSSGG
jgi:DNA polymerase-3 subunit delta'